MSLKRKFSSTSAPTISGSPVKLKSSALHPCSSEVTRVNRSQTRDHSRIYHKAFDKLNLAEDVHTPLLDWYGSRGDLPWRHDLSDEELASLSEEAKAQRAYEVWVSEIMLQQTQVATVIPYYKRWIEAFPTVRKLAQADIESVNALWKGLGYYSRASRLLDGAKTVVSSFGGQLPSDPEVLVKKIEGVGPYTAGAIASIAYGVKAATVDGNIQRVICRLLAIYADMKKKAVLDYIWEVADQLVPDKRAGHWNQALMDLGATVCTPKNPRCGDCPMQNVCLAYTEVRASKRSSASKDIEDIVLPTKAKACDMCLPLNPPSLDRDVTYYPLKVVKKKSRDEDIAVCVVEWVGAKPADGQASQVLLVKRPKTGLLAGLDEFPSVVMPESDSSATSRATTSLELLNELLQLPKSFSLKTVHDYTSLSVTGASDLGCIKHIYSHINASFHVRHLVMTSDKPPRIAAEKGRCRWVDRADLANANISTGAVKIWDLVNGKKAKVSKKAPKKDTSSGSLKRFLQPKAEAEKEHLQAGTQAADAEEDTPRKRKKLIIIESESE